MSEYELAGRYIENAIDESKKNRETGRGYIELGLCYEEIGEEEKRVECYQKALEHGEEREDYASLTQLYNIWGIYYAERGDTQRGEELFKKVLNMYEAYGGRSLRELQMYIKS